MVHARLIGRRDLHPHRIGHPSQFSSYGSQPNDTKGLTAQFIRGSQSEREINRIHPVSLLHRISVNTHLGTEMKHQGKDMLYHRVRTVTRDIGHADSPFLSKI